MTANSNTDIAWSFHNATKYLLSSGEPGSKEILMGDASASGPAMGEQNLANEPSAFKVYSTLPPIALPRASTGGHLSAAEAIASTGATEVSSQQLDLETLAHLCLRSNGILKQWNSPSGKEILFRAAGCTGARYHLELYLITGALDRLEAGIYHYSAFDHSFRLLRSGDFRGNVSAATEGEPTIAAAPVIMVCTSTFWRNAWRYQERAYRHVYWDVGTLFTSLLTTASDAFVPTNVVLGYDDAAINALLGVDGEREAAVALVALGRGDYETPAPSPIDALDLQTNPVSTSEIDFPLIREMHRASSLIASDVAAWRKRTVTPDKPAPTGKLIELSPLPIDQLPAATIDSVIEKRRSNRHYDSTTPLAFELFSTVLTLASHGTAMDVVDIAGPSLHDVYLIVNNVEGVDPGSYVYHRELQAIELLEAGDQRAAAQALACDQSYAAEVHLNAYALTDLTPLLNQFGNRGYRLAQLEAALFGGRLQLAAHLLGLGAVGSTSADDDVISHFLPHATGKSFMFIAVFGVRRRASAQEQVQSTRFIKNKDDD